MIYPNYYYRYNSFYNQQRNFANSNFSNYPQQKNLMNSNFPNSNMNPDVQDTINNDRNNMETKKVKKRIPSKHSRIANFNISNLFNSNFDEPVLEIFDIKLYFDDILILSLLLFLYKEGVNDEMLFICLILLLLT